MRFVILDDEATDRELIPWALRTWWPDARYDVVADLPALETALETAADVLLIDYLMPHCPWPQALRAAHRRQPQLCVIVMSGAISDDRGQAALRDGATYYVQKHQLDRLVPVIERALATRTLVEEQQALVQSAAAVVARLS